MSAVIQHQFTRQEYQRMAEGGIFDSDVRVELLNGQIIEMSPIGPFHGGVVNRLAQLFIERSQGRWFVSIQNPNDLDEYSEPQPDLMLLKPSADDYTNRHPTPDDVFLLIEVADSSLDKDRGEKLAAYARAGIPEVWIVNLLDESVEVYRRPVADAYEQRQVFNSGAQATVLAFPDVSVDVSRLLRRT